MKDIQVKYATPDDLDGLAPLFDAYRVFYQQPSDLNLARAFLTERLQLRESVILLEPISKIPPHEDEDASQL